MSAGQSVSQSERAFTPQPDLDNKVRRSVGAGDAPVGEALFGIPPELTARYLVRVIAAPDGGDRRVGMFLPRDKAVPSIEIAGDRIIARNEDPDLVAALVKIAQHNGWDRIDVEGSPAFRQAVWASAAREGLRVQGYEPSFAEAARVEELRQADAKRRARETVEQTAPAALIVVGAAPTLTRSAELNSGPASQQQPGARPDTGLSEDDRRLLLTLTRHAEDRATLHDDLREDRDAFQKAVQHERIEANRGALDYALDRALASQTLVSAFAKSGYAPANLRQMAHDGAWEKDVADAITRVRSGLDRTAPVRGDGLENEGARAGPRDNVAGDAVDRLVTESIASTAPAPSNSQQTAYEDQGRDDADERRTRREELAELFLNGAIGDAGADPRLANALKAQAAMEQHIGVLFDGDVNRATSATLESRQMISDVLRRGFDVLVREPTPVRQIEPIQPAPDLER